MVWMPIESMGEPALAIISTLGPALTGFRAKGAGAAGD